ncbi:MAG: nicotinamide mononucleotide transporter [Clostridia bacterium]|nr:nicotinamide mononucleotide transporter [Clostridia bacterium]
MKYQNPFKTLSPFQLTLWISSLVIITISFLLVPDKDYLTLIASLIGATALILVGNGDPFGQVLCIFFSLIYAVISYTYRYYGEMITYLVMSAPAALVCAIEWFKHPHREGENQVRVATLSVKKWLLLLSSVVVVTILFYFVLEHFGTNNLLVSTISVATSWFAAMLTLFRSPYYGIAYAVNDIVLIVLWIMASIVDISYLPMILCFIVFLLNDLYGFYNWTRIERCQSADAPTTE